MCINFDNEVEFFQQHISDLLKNVQDESGSPIAFSPTLLQQLLPAFFVSSQLEHLTANTNLTEITTLRKDGSLAFYQSLSSYTVKKFNNLTPALWERILLQAHKLLPLTKIASCLQLDSLRYNAQSDGCDRLTTLLGILFYHFGTLAVDSFLHPLFTAHIIGEKQPQPQPHAANFSTFRNNVQARGGSFEMVYQQTQIASAQTQSLWNCSIKYRLARDTPFVMHQRTGQNKKQARLRTLQDILNYYTYNDASLVLHCSSASSTSVSPVQSLHPHCQQQLGDGGPYNVVETLSIPIDQLYEYDDADSQQTTPPAAPSVKRSHDNMTEDSHMECNTNNSDNDGKQISFLTSALLYDFSNLSFSDAHQSSPTSLDSPASSISLKQSSSLNESTLATPTSMSSPTSTSASSIKTEPMNEEWTEQPTMMDGGNKKQRTDQLEGQFSQQSEDSLMDLQQPQQPSLMLSNPFMQQQQPTMDDSPPLQKPSFEELSATATRMVTLLSENSRQRMMGLANQLVQQPGTVKGFLINLVAKLNGGHYSCSMKHVQPPKTANTTPYFSATAILATSDLELMITRNNSRKADAETSAVCAILELLLKSSSTITSNCNNNNSNNMHPSPLPPSEMV